jgi:hypothetical protein
LFRLLFKNSEEARRVRFVTSEPGSSGYEIALFALAVSRRETQAKRTL